MRFGLDIAQHHLTWKKILERARLAEDHGFDGAWVFDHFRPLYGDRRGPCMEAWTLLAALAASTTRIRLGALVTGVTYRHPSILATEAITVDVISNGRLEFGIGAAWHADEHRMLGIDFPAASERMEQLEEAVRAITLLMTRDRATMRGAHFRLQDATYHPRPVQRPRPPVWIGGSGRKLLEIAGRHADVWHSFESGEELTRKIEVVRAHAKRAKRTAPEVSTQLDLSQPWDDVRRDIDDATERGVSYMTVGWPSEGRARLKRFCSTVMPAYAR